MESCSVFVEATGVVALFLLTMSGQIRAGLMRSGWQWLRGHLDRISVFLHIVNLVSVEMSWVYQRVGPKCFLALGLSYGTAHFAFIDANSYSAIGLPPSDVGFGDGSSGTTLETETLIVEVRGKEK
ncbi:hypothetical protein PIB30_014431 [Stylosanthes scabra]|uniref:Uncharacterized protein n=1 Tax=Stylosanthes scabra TaxID=79078 RepID=A0ABU6V516_9FABA|nr:hypothetical protein [Stylosanthes scabra]